MVHTCPRCELRFENDRELSDHLRVDHDVDLEPPDPLRYDKDKGDKPRD